MTVVETLTVVIKNVDINGVSIVKVLKKILFINNSCH